MASERFATAASSPAEEHIGDKERSSNERSRVSPLSFGRHPYVCAVRAYAVRAYAMRACASVRQTRDARLKPGVQTQVGLGGEGGFRLTPHADLHAVPQRLRFRQPLELLQRVVLDLADPLARDSERLTDLLERARLGAAETEAQLDHLALALG